MVTQQRRIKVENKKKQIALSISAQQYGAKSGVWYKRWNNYK